MLGINQVLCDSRARPRRNHRRGDRQQLGRSNLIQGLPPRRRNQQHRQRNRNRDRDRRIQHPAHPRKRDRPGPPVRDAQRAPRGNERGKAHGDRTEEERVGAVGDHDGPDLWVGDVSEDGDEQGAGEEEGVEAEEEDGEPVEPGCLEGDGDEEEGDYACAGCDGEPGGREVADDATPADLVVAKEKRHVSLKKWRWWWVYFTSYFDGYSSSSSGITSSLEPDGAFVAREFLDLERCTAMPWDVGGHSAGLFVPTRSNSYSSILIYSPQKIPSSFNVRSCAKKIALPSSYFFF